MKTTAKVPKVISNYFRELAKKREPMPKTHYRLMQKKSVLAKLDKKK